MVAKSADGFRPSFLPGHRPCKCRHASSSTVRENPSMLSSSRNAGGQLPFAQHAGISEDLKRLAPAGVARAPSSISCKARSHDVLRPVFILRLIRLQMRAGIRDVAYESCRHRRRLRQPSHNTSAPWLNRRIFRRPLPRPRRHAAGWAPSSRSLRRQRVLHWASALKQHHAIKFARGRWARPASRDVSRFCLRHRPRHSWL